MIFVKAAALIACVVTAAPQRLDASAAPVTAHPASAGVAARADAHGAVAHDRTFHPDYSHALSVEQMSRAWNDEIDRINEPANTGGG